MIETLRNLPNIVAFLKRKGMDPNDIKTPRQALFFAKRLSGADVAWPSKHEPIFPALMEMEKKLDDL